MRRQSRVSASCTPQVPSWNHQKNIAHLVERPGIQVYHATLFSAGFTVLSRGLQKMQVWCEHIRTHWSAKERLHLIASVPREDTINIPDLITLLSASLTLLRCLPGESLQGEIQLCQ